MAVVVRIKDRFRIEGRGIVYIVKAHEVGALYINDILYDLQGNSFRLTAIEMFRHTIVDVPFEQMDTGILLQPLNGTDVKGNILITTPSEVSFLFCNHPLYPQRVDEDYEEEYQAAGQDHPCALISYEDLVEGKISLYGEQIHGLTIYRGWMLKPVQYRYLYEQLEKRNILLINSPEEYERYHLIPGWYNDFKEETPLTIWTEGADMKDILYISRSLEGPYIVKDYVKSRKHEWYDACFISNAQDRVGLEEVVRTFIERQGDDLIGGVVLRRFEKLNQIGFHGQSGMPVSEEYRVFIYAGQILTINPYWEGEEDTPLSQEEYQWLETIAGRIKSNFVTVDLARKDDGSLIIMELGDGQVSGLQQLDARDFYQALREQFVCSSSDGT